MKKLIVIGLVFTLFTACAGVPYVLGFLERRWRLASAEELGDKRAGKAVFRYCSKTSWLGHCKEYKLDVVDLCTTDGHDKFLLGGFVLYNEKNLR